MKLRAVALPFLFVITIIILSGCGRPEVPEETRATILMLEDQRNPDMDQFMEYLTSDNPAVRARACLALGRIGVQDRPDPYREDLLNLLKDEDAGVREMAAFALGEIEDDESADALMAALMDSDPRVRATAAEAISKLEAEHTALAMEKIIRSDPVEHVRERTLMTSFRLNSIKTAQAAMEILRDGPSGLTWPAAYHFLRHRMTAELNWDPELLKRLADNEDPEIRKATARLLVHLRNASAIGEILDKLLMDNDMYVQVNALRTAGRMAYPGMIPVLLEFHQSAAVQVRQTMAEAAGTMLQTMAENEMGESQEYQDVLLVLRNLVNDANQAVASEAVTALASLGEEMAALLEAETLLQDERPWVRAAAIKLLQYQPENQRHDWLQRLLEDSSTKVQIEAGMAVSVLNNDFASQTMQQLLEGDDLILVSLAASYFERLGEAEYVELLIAAYKRYQSDPNPEAIQSILSALNTFRQESEAAMSTLEEALESPHYSIRFAVARMLDDVKGEAVYEAVGINDNGRDLGWYQEALLQLDRFSGMRLITEEGEIEIEFFADAAPLTCYNFIVLAEKDFFGDTIIHRVIPDFVAQMGDPRGDGWGGPGYSIRSEINQKLFETGAVGMAHAGKDTGGSQFFIAYSPQPHLDGRHTVFGTVTAGMEVARKLHNGAALKSVELLEAE